MMSIKSPKIDRHESSIQIKSKLWLDFLNRNYYQKVAHIGGYEDGGEHLVRSIVSEKLYLKRFIYCILTLTSCNTTNKIVTNPNKVSRLRRVEGFRQPGKACLLKFQSTATRGSKFFGQHARLLKQRPITVRFVI